MEGSKSKQPENTLSIKFIKKAFTPFNPPILPCLWAFRVNALHFLRVHGVHRVNPIIPSL